MRPHHHDDGHDPRHRSHHPADLFDRADDGSPRRGPARGPGRGRGGRGRVPRGDVRAAVLLLLADEPMHGYQLMQAIAERSGGRWTPSPGAIYPAINQLEDEALVTVTAESGRKVVALTEAGREYVDVSRESWPDPFAGFAEPRSGPDLRELLEQLHGATRQVGRTGSDAQVQAAAAILTEARRSLYLLLADGPEASHD
jgi:DNA-binding PadR family transcriptional regulator